MKYRAESINSKSLIAALASTIGAFLMLSVILYFGSISALKHSSFRFSRIAAGDLHVDVLVVGNSRARDLVVGRSADNPPTVFNLAYNGLSRENTIAWVKTFFREGNTAASVVFETTALYDGSRNCDGKPYWVLYRELFNAQRSDCLRDAGAARYFPLTMFNSEQFLRALYYLALKPHGDQSWGDDNDISAALCSRLPLDGIYEFRDQAVNVDISVVGREIGDLKHWLAENRYRTRLVFVLAPFFADTRVMPAIADIERVNAKLLGAESYLSIATALGSDCRNFADAVHIGRIGRPKTVPLLFDYLGFGSH